jgi:hypothetical protein
MLILRVLRIVARLRKRRRRAAKLFVRLDRRTLATSASGRARWSRSREAGVQGLHREPHV